MLPIVFWFQSQHLCSAYQTVPGTSSGESCSSGVGSQSSGVGSQSGSNPWGEVDPGAGSGGQGPPGTSFLGLARVHSIYIPAADEKEFLHLKVTKVDGYAF